METKNNNFNDIYEESPLEKLLYADDSNVKNDYPRDYRKHHPQDKSFNAFAFVLKIVATIILIAGIMCGFSILSTAREQDGYFLVIASIGTLIGTMLLFLFFFALGEIISILHDIRSNQ